MSNCSSTDAVTEPTQEPVSLADDELRLVMGEDVARVALTWSDAESVLRSLGHLVNDSLSGAVQKRRVEFAAGRHAAALALVRFGCTTPMGQNSDGSPDWPAHFVGSISHADQLAVAAVARADSHRGLGIDIERIVSTETLEELIDHVLAPSERTLLHSKLPTMNACVHFSLGFSIKESLFKCLYPLCGEFFDFEDAELTHVKPRDIDTGDAELRLTRALPGGFQSGFSLRGRYALGARRVETVVALERHAL